MVDVLFVREERGLRRDSPANRFAGDLAHHSTRASVARTKNPSRYLLGSGDSLEEARSSAKPTSNERILSDFPLEGGIGWVAPVVAADPSPDTPKERKPRARRKGKNQKRENKRNKKDK